MNTEYESDAWAVHWNNKAPQIKFLLERPAQRIRVRLFIKRRFSVFLKKNPPILREYARCELYDRLCSRLDTVIKSNCASPFWGMSLFLLRKQAPGFRKAVPDLALCRRYVTQNFLQTWWRPFFFFNKEKSAKVVIETQQLAWKIIPWMFEHFFPFRTVISSFHCAEVRIKSSPPCTQAKK